MLRHLSRFLRTRAGSVTTFFALAVPVMAALSVFAISLGERNQQASAAQTAIDAAALAGAVQYTSDTSTPGTRAATVQKILSSYMSRIQDIVSNSTVDFDDTAQTVKVSYKSSRPLIGSGFFSGASLPINLTAKASLGGGIYSPVCILITNPVDAHTLKTDSGAKLDITDCMTQVNTANWDAVEAAGASYIHGHGSNYQNCFVGDIHFGDVTPGKQKSCTMFSDPFAAYALPASASHCDYSKVTAVNSTTSLNPGTYCQDIQINADVTFTPGIYILKGSNLNIQSGNVNAAGVVFILTGGNTQVSITTTGKVTLAGYGGSADPQFRGFVVFQDQLSLGSGGTGGKAGGPKGGGGKAAGPQLLVQNAVVDSTGIIYLAGVEMDINQSTFTHKGSLVADFLLPTNSAVVNLNGPANPAANPASTALQKQVSQVPILTN